MSDDGRNYEFMRVKKLFRILVRRYVSDERKYAKNGQKKEVPTLYVKDDNCRDAFSSEFVSLMFCIWVLFYKCFIHASRLSFILLMFYI